MSTDLYEREAAKAAIHTLQREIKTLRARVKELEEASLDWFMTAQELKGHAEELIHAKGRHNTQKAYEKLQNFIQTMHKPKP